MVVNLRLSKSGLTADGIEVGGDVILDQGFQAEGEVRLLGAKIEGQLNCTNASFTNENGKALNADGIQLGGSVFLDYGFRASGEVRVLGAKIEGVLNCRGGSFSNGNGPALNADGIQLGGSVFLDNGFRASGEVRFLGATIKGQLNCREGFFSNENGDSITAQGITVMDSVFLDQGFQAVGEVRLFGATIKGRLACGKGSFSNKNGKAINADGIQVGGDVFLNNDFRALGEVIFCGATIKGQLACRNGSFSNEKGYALSAEKIQVGGHVFLDDGFQAVGEVRLLGATIKGQLSCTNGSFSNEDGDALNAQGITVTDSVFLGQDFQAEGRIDISRATINGALVMDDWIPDALSKSSLDLRAAKAGMLMDATSAWPHKGNLFLDGFIYDSISEGSPLSAEDRLDWLDRQDDDRFRAQPYEQLATVLRLYGQEQDAREVLYQKNNKLLWFLTHGSLARRQKWYRERLNSKALEEPLASYYKKMLDLKNKDFVHDYTPLSRGWWGEAGRWSGYLRIAWMWLLRFSIGFGYRTWRATLFFVLFLVIGIGFFACADLHDLMTPAQQYVHLAGVPEHLPSSPEWLRLHQEDASLASLTANDYPDFSPVIYAMDTFIPLVELGQETYWIPKVHASSPVRFRGYELFTATGRVVRWFLVVYILIGWVLTTLIVASLTGLLKK